MAEYIERQTALRKIRYYEKTYKCVKHYCSDTVKKIPAADVAPVNHGHWEKDEECIFQCSKCKRLAVPTQFGQHLGNYCPNCGAKMDGKEGEQ